MRLGGAPKKKRDQLPVRRTLPMAVIGAIAIVALLCWGAHIIAARRAPPLAPDIDEAPAAADVDEPRGVVEPPSTTRAGGSGR